MEYGRKSRQLVFLIILEVDMFCKYILPNYTDLRALLKLFLFFRWITAPFVDTEKEIQKQGLILDIGCGHGLFDVLLAYKNNKRKIIGIDPDEGKISIAKQLEKRFPNLQFQHRYFHPSDFKQKLDTVILNDIEYLLSPKEKKNLLLDIKKVLSGNGLIVLKTNHNNRSLGFFLCYLQEVIATRLLSFTHAGGGLYFFTLKQYRDLFQECGLKIAKEKEMKTAFFHPHYLFLLKKAS